MRVSTSMPLRKKNIAVITVKPNRYRPRIAATRPNRPTSTPESGATNPATTPATEIQVKKCTRWSTAVSSMARQVHEVMTMRTRLFTIAAARNQGKPRAKAQSSIAPDQDSTSKTSVVRLRPSRSVIQPPTSEKTSWQTSAAELDQPDLHGRAAEREHVDGRVGLDEVVGDRPDRARSRGWPGCSPRIPAARRGWWRADVGRI